MDPQACLTRYLTAFVEGDREEMNDAAEDYNTWITGGGFTANLEDGRRVCRLGPHLPHPVVTIGAGEAAVDLTPRQVIDALGAQGAPFKGSTPSDASAGDHDVDVAVAFDLLHDELKQTRSQLSGHAEGLRMLSARIARDDYHVRTTDTADVLSTAVTLVRYMHKLRDLAELESELSRQCGDKP